MKIIDSIYREFDIEDILEELINTKEIQRLKGIYQGGASYLVNEKWNVTRYEHSIGAMLLIRIMGGSIEEQIAGLLHDVSHTAFSHVVDFALKNSTEDYHEKIYDEIIEKSKIPEILLSNGYDYKDILFNEKKWTILEKPLPKLCADRVDYTLRDRYEYGHISKEEVERFLDNLTMVKGELVIKSLEVAEWFVDTYYKEVVGFFMHPLNVYGYDRLSKALKLALDFKEITLEDLLKEDKEVYRLLENSKIKEVLELINDLKDKVTLIEDKNNYEIFQKNKLRMIDPTVIIENEIFKVSEKSQVAKLLSERALKKAKQGSFLKVVKEL